MATQVSNFNVPMNTSQILRDTIANQDARFHNQVAEVMTHLALCHDVVINKNKGTFSSASPDELALVNGAKSLGFVFMGRDGDNNIHIKMPSNELQEYRLLNTLEFNSTRKRMSVVVENAQTGEIKLLCKGADSIMTPLLAENEANRTNIDQVQKYVDAFAVDGLRTLILASKVLPKHEYEKWNEKFEAAQNSVKGRDQAVEAVNAEIEFDMDLVGCTAIEDKLQEEVAETIVSFKDAGIKVWVLTGDKVETAVNIGYSCGLLNQHMKQHVLDSADKGKIYDTLNDILMIFGSDRDSSQKSALIVANESLLKIEKHKPLLEKFLKVTDHMDVVLACRVSPKQKGEIVQMIKKRFNDKITLAIGDGANDVPMLLAAHVGIGIAGREGMQAARASDYAIGKFKYLKTLLFVHGREAYRRNCDLVCYNFYKNLVYISVQFFFGFYSVFSGMPLYEAFIYQMYNPCYTGVANMWWAVMDLEFPKKVFMKNSQLYRLGIERRKFSTAKFWQWNFYAFYHAIIILFCGMVVTQIAVFANGQTYDFWAGGHVVFFFCIVVVNLVQLQMTNNLTGWGELLIFSQILFFFPSYWVICWWADDNVVYGIFEQWHMLPVTWFGLALTCCILMLFDWGVLQILGYIKGVAKKSDKYTVISESIRHNQIEPSNDSLEDRMPVLNKSECSSPSPISRQQQQQPIAQSLTNETNGQRKASEKIVSDKN